MTKESLLSKAEREIKTAKSLRIKVFKFDKGEIHPTIAADYDRQRRALLFKLNSIESCAKKEFGIRIPNLYPTKTALWSLGCSIKYRTSEEAS